MFLHDESDFQDLVDIAASKVGLDPALVEKDYWITHTLWELHRCGLEVWFKGGTSLSKGFGIIERFSEDLDLQVERGEATGLPEVTSWKKNSEQATSTREDFFRQLPNAIDLPTSLELQEGSFDPRKSRAEYRFHYPGQRVRLLPAGLSGFVLLELGRATVTPCLGMPMSSFVHDHAEEVSMMGSVLDNRPASVRCLHPVVTLVEKISAIHEGIQKEKPPVAFVRHYEDAARIIACEKDLPALTEGDLAKLRTKHLVKLTPLDNSFLLPAEDRLPDLERAHSGIGNMFWGERISIEACCTRIRDWVDSHS